jgi:hypothetical protein
MTASRLISSFFVFLLLTSTLQVNAQSNTRAFINGQVVDAESKQPLPGAHVFIAGSMIGTVTDMNGKYDLTNVPMGAHRLYVSMLGFEHDFRDIMLRVGKDYAFDFELKENVLEVGEITIEAERDKNWP